MGSNALIVIGLLIVVPVAIYFVLIYNKMLTLKNRVDNAWSQIDVQLKRRNDIVPNLVETVKGYAKHESEVLESVTRARAVAITAKDAKETEEAANQLTATLKSLFSVTEAYPDLKANQNFLQLQKDLAETEDRITYSRQFYNDTVTMFNTTIGSIPNNIVAAMFGYKKRELFSIATEELKTPVVKF